MFKSVKPKLYQRSGWYLSVYLNAGFISMAYLWKSIKLCTYDLCTLGYHSSYIQLLFWLLIKTWTFSPIVKYFESTVLVVSKYIDILIFIHSFSYYWAIRSFPVLDTIKKLRWKFLYINTHQRIWLMISLD